MLTTNISSILSIDSMTSMEVSLLYYLIKDDVCQHHLVKLSFSSFYLTMFGEMYKSGNSRTLQIEFNNAVNHFEELGLISTVLDSYNCKIVNITELYEEDIVSFISFRILNEDCYKIFKDLNVAKHIKLKIFKTYMYIITADYMINDKGLECLPDEQVCKDLGLSYNTYNKYLKYLEDVALINWEQTNPYV